MYLPKRISDFLANAEIKPEAEGMSSADVCRCRTVSEGKEEYYYLKTEPWKASVENEHRLYQWLYEDKRLPVPEPLFCVAEERPDTGQKYGYLLIRQAKGEILRTPKYYADPVRLAKLAAEGLKMLWQVDTKTCPVRVNLDEKLKLAEEELRRGGFEGLDASVPYTKDFKNHAEVFEFLVKNQPETVPVFTHGDYCLNNFSPTGSMLRDLLILEMAAWGMPIRILRCVCGSLSSTARRRFRIFMRSWESGRQMRRS